MGPQGFSSTHQGFTMPPSSTFPLAITLSIHLLVSFLLTIFLSFFCLSSFLPLFRSPRICLYFYLLYQWLTKTILLTTKQKSTVNIKKASFKIKGRNALSCNLFACCQSNAVSTVTRVTVSLWCCCCCWCCFPFVCVNATLLSVPPPDRMASPPGQEEGMCLQGEEQPGKSLHRPVTPHSMASQLK